MCQHLEVQRTSLFLPEPVVVSHVCGHPCQVARPHSAWLSPTIIGIISRDCAVPSSFDVMAKRLPRKRELHTSQSERQTSCPCGSVDREACFQVLCQRRWPPTFLSSGPGLVVDDGKVQELAAVATLTNDERGPVRPIPVSRDALTRNTMLVFLKKFIIINFCYDQT